MSPLRIAIVGGGILSICLAHGLLNQAQGHNQPPIVKIFEASTDYRDEGASIGLARNAQDALSLISPSLREALDEAGGTRMDPALRLMMGTGPDSGKHIGDEFPIVNKIVTQRGAFWRALKRRIPDNVLETGKRLVRVDGIDGGEHELRLNFEDGSMYEADALIGCDGISSVTRKYVLGEDHPAVAPVYTGGYVHRVVMPMETAIEAFGKDYCSLVTQHGWIGNQGFLLTDLADNGQSMQVIAGWNKGETWSHPGPFVEWSKDRLKEDLADWGEVGKAMIEIFTSQSKLYAAGGRTHLNTPKYCNGPICIAGDAAQSFPPFRGAGVGQAIEDALILSTVLSRCPAKCDIALAFKTYDAVRRPRRSRVAEASEQAAKIFTGQDQEIGLDVDRLATQLPGWNAWIEDVDLAAMKEEAVEAMNELRAVQSRS